jgi:hypothetical protein
MEILNWITRRPRTDERLRLDQADDANLDPAKAGRSSRSGIRVERSVSPSLLAFWEALR